MLPLRETKMDKISQSSDHVSPRIRVDDAAFTDHSDINSRAGNQPNIDNPDFESKDEANDAILSTEEAPSVGLEHQPEERGTAKPSEYGIIMKKRTWRKPKDKPKRPLSSYNLYFQHQRERIVEGKTGEASPEEIVQSIEAILSRPATKRRHRKSHGMISFGDLARTIAESWKSVSPKAKSIFEHYAERDSLRYKRELKVWKDRKDMELEATTLAKHSSFMNSMNMSSSLRSEGSTTSEYLDSLPREGNISQHSTSISKNNPVRSFSSSLNSSMDSISFNMSLTEPESIQQAFHRQQQILQQQLRMDNNLNSLASFANIHTGARGLQNQGPMAPGSSAFHSSFSSFPSRMGTGHSGLSGGMESGGPWFGGSDMPFTISSRAADPLLGTSSSFEEGFQGMQTPTRVSSDSAQIPSGVGRNMGSMSMMGHASLSTGFSQRLQQQQFPSHMMMSPAMMGMINQQQQQSEIDFMQQKLEYLQAQQRRLQMQQQVQAFSTPHMGSSSTHSLGDALGSGHVVSDRSHSDNNASISTFASAQGFGSFGGSGSGHSRQAISMQQQLHHQTLMTAGASNSNSVLLGMSGSGRGSGPMNISISSDRPSLDQQSMNDFMGSNQGGGFMGGDGKPHASL